MSYCVDANVFITAWYATYPPKTFPSLYPEMESKLPNKIILIKPIFDEIEPISGSKKSAEELRKEHPVRFWLKEQMGIDETPIDDNVKQKSLKLMQKYKPEESAKGASENERVDILHFDERLPRLSRFSVFPMFLYRDLP